MGTLSMAEVAPVVLIIYNRPRLTAKTFESIRAAKPRKLLVVADGPKSTIPGDAELCEAARKIVTPDWPCELLTRFAEHNLGCRKNVSSGLSWVFENCNEAIILEDDCLACASFFKFCSAMLARYRDDARIMHVSGDNFNPGVRRGSGSYYFSKYSFSWGWASWRRAWRYYDAQLTQWPLALKQNWLASILDDPLEIEYWTNIFERLFRGEIDTWDYQWLFACWCQHGLSILPNENLVTNIGVGPDATNYKQAHSMTGLATGEISEIIEPEAMIPDKVADRSTFELHMGGKQIRRGQTWWRRARNLVRFKTVTGPRQQPSVVADSGRCK